MKIYSIVFITLALSGCGTWLKSDYQRPMLSIPAVWRIQDTGAGYINNTTHWWDNFQDPQLSRVLIQVLETNNDLALAGIQLKQARIAAGLSNTNLTPNVSVEGAASNSKTLKDHSASTESYSTSLGLSYELDLWGKLAQEREESAWRVKASEQDKQATALLLIGTTAQLYWQIAKLNQQIDNQQQSLDIANETLGLVHSRYLAGDVGQQDLLQAQQTLLDRQNQYHSLVQQREESRNAITLLFNRSPEQRPSELRTLNINQTVPIAARLPLDVISQRPDVRAAEWNLRAALAGSDVEKLRFYPSLSLNASLGAGSSIFQQWFNSPVRTLGTAVTLPFVQWNRVQLTIEKSKLDVQRAAIEFRSKVYSALSDVDNAMTQRLTYQQQKQNQRQNLKLSQQRLSLAKSQYESGSVSFQTLLDAQDALFAGESNLAEIQYNYLNSTMKLWLALGGGINNVDYFYKDIQ